MLGSATDVAQLDLVSTTVLDNAVEHADFIRQQVLPRLPADISIGLMRSTGNLLLQVEELVIIDMADQQLRRRGIIAGFNRVLKARIQEWVQRLQATKVPTTILPDCPP